MKSAWYRLPLSFLLLSKSSSGWTLRITQFIEGCKIQSNSKIMCLQDRIHLRSQLCSGFTITSYDFKVCRFQKFCDQQNTSQNSASETTKILAEFRKRFQSFTCRCFLWKKCRRCSAQPARVNSFRWISNSISGTQPSPSAALGTIVRPLSFALCSSSVFSRVWRGFLSLGWKNKLIEAPPATAQHTWADRDSF